MAGVNAKHIGWMDIFRERINLPFTGMGEYTSKNIGDVYVILGSVLGLKQIMMGFYD